MEKEPLISVIVPVYNVEEYLKQCVESILSQTYRNLEIFLVDDGSTDSSGKMCDEYAAKDSRIQVIHKANGGLSDARNTAIALCRGAYISFIDSDDYVSPFFIEVLYQAVRKENCDIALLHETSDFWDGEELSTPLAESGDDYTARYMSARDALETMLYQIVPTGAQFKLYRKELFQNVRFPYGLYYEDVATTYRTLLAAQKAVIVDSIIYAYRMRKNGIIRQPFSQKKMSAVPIFDQLIQDQELRNAGLDRAGKSRAYAALYSVFLQIPRDQKENMDQAWNRLKSVRWDILTNPNPMIRRKNKLGALASYLGRNASWYLGRKFGQKGSMN